jgi:predicted RNase H-like HicB family nuclease
MSLQYSMIIQWSDEDQVYVVSLPEFGPYTKTHGSSYEEAARMGQEVLELLVDTRQDDQKPLPEPLKFGSHVTVPSDA